MAIIKPALAVVGAIASSMILSACSNQSPANGALPSGVAAQRVKVAGATIPASSLNLFTRGTGSDGRDLRVAGNVTGSRVLYASLFEGQIFHGYTLPKKKPFCQSQPVKLSIVNSIGTDKDGNLWLPTAFVGSPGAIYSFGANCGAPGPTLSIPLNADPSGIAFGPDGTKYGLMTYYGSIDTTSVSVYPPGATSPTAELTDARLNNRPEPADGVGADSAGNVYVTCCDALKVDRFAIEFTGQGSQQKGTKIVLQQIAVPGGSVTFDRSNNMIVPDAGGTSLNVYAPPYTGTPAVYALKGRPWQCALTRKQGTIACANLDANTIDLYAYPSMSYRYSLKSQVYPSITFGGVAFSPSQ
jgi:hypothetical protein